MPKRPWPSPSVSGSVLRWSNAAKNCSISCQWRHHQDYVWKAEVCERSDHEILTRTVEVNTDNFSTTCPCRWFEETGRPCYDTTALIIAQNLDPHDPRWYNEVYHTTTYREAFNNKSPDLTTRGKLAVSNMVPPDHKVTSGRPKKKRLPSTSNNKRTCMKCGLEGHMGSTCNKPNTEYRYGKNKDKATTWAYDIVMATN